MALNPWLLTWEIANPNNTVPRNLIAAVLPNNTATGFVHGLMSVLYHNLGDYLSDQLLHATRKCGYKVVSYGPLPEYHIGSSPSLFARQVWNYEVAQDRETGNEAATWEDRSVELKDGNPTGFWWMRKKTYDKAKNVIHCEPPVKIPIPQRKARK